MVGKHTNFLCTWNPYDKLALLFCHFQKSNPLPDEEKLTSTRHNGEPKRQNIFQERLRAEHESFRAVFESFRTGSDKRRQRIFGLNAEDE